MACGSTKMAAIAITATVAREPISEQMLFKRNLFNIYVLPNVSRLKSPRPPLSMSPSPAPLRMELIPVSGIERKGTVKVRPSWMSWLVVPVRPKYFVAAAAVLSVWGVDDVH